MARQSNTESGLLVVLKPAVKAESVNRSADQTVVPVESPPYLNKPEPPAASSLKALEEMGAPKNEVLTDRRNGDSQRQVIKPAPPTVVISPPVSEGGAQSEYRSVGLDPPPRPLHDIEPEYPLQGGVREGSVVLRLLINEKGIVDEAIVLRSFPPRVFDSSAVLAFSSAKFSPGMFLGIPVKAQLTVEVEFMPTNRGPTVSGRNY